MPGDHELKLREFGSKQAAWIKLLTLDGLEAEESLRTLGPGGVARPAGARPAARLPAPAALAPARPAVIAGIGRTWVDEILHAAQLSPFKRGDDLSTREAKALREAMRSELGA